MRRLLVSTILVGLPAMAQAIEFPEESGRAAFNQAASPFAPTLVVNQDPLCPALLDRARKIYSTGDSRYQDLLAADGRLAEFGGIDLYSLPSETVEFESTKLQQYTLTTTASNVFIRRLRFPGCGGGCETEHWVLSSDIPDSPTVTTEALPEWSLRTDEKAWYALGLSRESLVAYRLDGAAAPRKACMVELAAPEARHSKDPAVQAMLPVLDAQTLAIEGVMRGAGNCGSMRSHNRAAGASRDALQIALFRPWVLEEKIPADELRLWSLQGLSEFSALNLLKKQFIETRDRLAIFYLAQKFAGTRQDSADLATRALSGATAMAFSFSGNYLRSPDAAEERLRTAILAHRPISEIRAIAFDIDDIDSALVTRFEGGRAETRSTDSILAVAVDYPEAFEYLLQRGVSPNRPNGFGKTPLMFAAQYDQLRAVELLLAHGANPNASTVRPADDCYYTLDSSDVTALHYAARYAAPAVMEKLVAAGAATYFAASGRREGAFAVDWLKSYRKFPAETMTRLERTLAVPDASARAEIASSLVKHAAREYRAKRVESAYQILRAALRASPDNVEALADFSLVALRAAHAGESLEASTKLLTIGQPAVQANAWFNVGLACEPRQHQFFNGRYYCQHSRIYPYLQSWRVQPSPARERKIAEVLARWETRGCVIGQGAAQQQYWFASSDENLQRPRAAAQRIYVRHEPGVTIPPDAVQWERQVYDREHRTSASQRETSTAVERYDFSDFAVTVLTAEVYPQGTLNIGTQACKLE